MKLFDSSLIPLPSSLTLWCRGEDSNLRRALARRVYSPVPLTTRPPLPALSNGCWSRRRDLNPRHSDYKSDALPTELRRPAYRQSSASSGKTRILPTASLKRKRRRTSPLKTPVVQQRPKKYIDLPANSTLGLNGLQAAQVCCSRA